MADSHLIDETTELAALERSCKSFSIGLQAVATRFQSATEVLGLAWQDSMYAATKARVEPILAVCNRALLVVTQSLEPFITKKRIWAESRPNV